MDESSLSAVIEALYEAALDEAHWARALEKLTKFTDSQAATFWVLDGADQPRLPTFSYVNLDPSFVQDYLDNVAHLDPTVQYLIAHPNEHIVHDGLVITEREKDLHPYYDWHGRYSDLRFRLVGQICPAPAVHAGVALHRTRKFGRYEPQDVERFTILYRHIHRALTVGFRMGTLGALQQCTTELLDRNPVAILLLDDHKRVVYMNRTAEVLVSSDDGVRLMQEGISVLYGRDNEKLQTFIAQALSPVVPQADSHGGSMCVSRPSGKRPYGLLVCPVSKQYPALSLLRPAVCILITDPDTQPHPPIARLRTIFGLTEAEANLAARLVTGEDLRSAAAVLGITYGTARVRLAEIFQKTDTRRQGELITLLLTTLATG